MIILAVFLAFWVATIIAIKDYGRKKLKASLFNSSSLQLERVNKKESKRFPMLSL